MKNIKFHMNNLHQESQWMNQYYTSHKQIKYPMIHTMYQLNQLSKKKYKQSQQQTQNQTKLMTAVQKKNRSRISMKLRIAARRMKVNLKCTKMLNVKMFQAAVKNR